MNVPEVKVTHGYLLGVQREVKSAITVICEKKSLSGEDTQAIRTLTQVIDRLSPNAILVFRKETESLLPEDYSQRKKD
ncbi:hypothetical protein [Lacrimispora indolis]|uniref:hypothetical protein n=1 Tax=Lacrimispora indolis TaxID=69825 RepID=UPI0004626110|nr:hypothetical protein [[Clostridium] methoxybenzovorans]